jgi:hypothetical protein
MFFRTMEVLLVWNMTVFVLARKHLFFIKLINELVLSNMDLLMMLIFLVFAG